MASPKSWYLGFVIGFALVTPNLRRRAAAAGRPTVVTSQLDAFERGDAAGAWRLASPEVREKFGSAAEFHRHRKVEVWADLPPPQHRLRPLGAPRRRNRHGGDDRRRGQRSVVRGVSVVQAEDGAWRTSDCLLAKAPEPASDGEPEPLSVVAYRNVTSPGGFMRKLRFGSLGRCFSLWPPGAADDFADAKAVISHQLEAFTHDDAQAPGRWRRRDPQKFADADAFMAMVKTLYPPVYRRRSAEFGKQSRAGDEIAQEMVFVDESNDVWAGVYKLQRQGDGAWKITAACWPGPRN